MRDGTALVAGNADYDYEFRHVGGYVAGLRELVPCLNSWDEEGN